jgi:hypothetical protein
LVYADGDNILDGRVHTMQRNTETLVAASMETGLVVNADETKHMVISCDQNEGQSFDTKNEIV